MVDFVEGVAVVVSRFPEMCKKFVEIWRRHCGSAALNGILMEEDASQPTPSLSPQTPGPAPAPDSPPARCLYWRVSNLSPFYKKTPLTSPTANDARIFNAPLHCEHMSLNKLKSRTKHTQTM